MSLQQIIRLTHPIIIRNPALLSRISSTGILMQKNHQGTSSPSEEFFTRNEKLKRPLSPWMIYKFQLTSMLSITHRATGLGLGVLMYGMGINSCFAGHTNWEQTLDAIHAAVPSPILYTFKVLVASAVGYHLFNGIRHLAWDMGFGFTLKELYASGYVIIGITLICAMLAAMNA